MRVVIVAKVKKDHVDVREEVSDTGVVQRRWLSEELGARIAEILLGQGVYDVEVMSR